MFNLALSSILETDTSKPLQSSANSHCVLIPVRLPAGGMILEMLPEDSGAKHESCT